MIDDRLKVIRSKRYKEKREQFTSLTSSEVSPNTCIA